MKKENFEKKQRAKELAQLYKKRPVPNFVPKRKPRKSGKQKDNRR